MIRLFQTNGTGKFFVLGCFPVLCGSGGAQIQATQSHGKACHLTNEANFDGVTIRVQHQLHLTLPFAHPHRSGRYRQPASQTEQYCAKTEPQQAIDRVNVTSCVRATMVKVKPQQHFLKMAKQPKVHQFSERKVDTGGIANSSAMLPAASDRKEAGYAAELRIHLVRPWLPAKRSITWGTCWLSVSCPWRLAANANDLTKRNDETTGLRQNKRNLLWFVLVAALMSGASAEDEKTVEPKVIFRNGQMEVDSDEPLACSSCLVHSRVFHYKAEFFFSLLVCGNIWVY